MNLTSIEQKTKLSFFYISEKLRKEPIFEALKTLTYNQNNTYNYILNLQLSKLKNVIRFAYQNTQYYKNIFRKNNITPSSIRHLSDMKYIPITTKNDLRNNVEAIKASSSLQVYPVKTSGSTGEPLYFYKDRIASAYSYASMYRGLKWHGIDICCKEAYLWGIPLAKKDYLLAKLRDFCLNRFRESHFDLSSDTFFKFCRSIRLQKPEFLSGYATLIYEFAKYVDRHPNLIKGINFKIIKYTAEMLHSYQKEYIERVFCCPVVSEYGSAECGIITFQCPYGENHVMSDNVYLELIPHSEKGYYKVVVTNLNSFGFPLIRYDTGDLSTSDRISHCQCGNPLPIIDSIIGRTSDIVYTPEGKKIHSNIFSYIIKDLLKTHQYIKQLRFKQVRPNLIYIYICPDTYNSELCKVLTEHISNRISPKVELAFFPESKPKRSSSGKLCYFESEV